MHKGGAKAERGYPGSTRVFFAGIKPGSTTICNTICAVTSVSALTNTAVVLKSTYRCHDTNVDAAQHSEIFFRKFVQPVEHVNHY